MPPEPEDFDARAKRMGWLPSGEDGGHDEFDAHAARMGWKPPAEPEASAEEPGTGSGWLDALLGTEEGLTLGNTHNLGKLGAALGTRAADLFAPSLERDGMAPEYAGDRGEPEWLSDLTGKAQETGLGKLGRGVGTGISSIGLSGLVGPGVGAQAGAGAFLGGASGAGESDGDWRAILAGMAEGGAFGAAGGALGKAGNAVAQGSDEILGALPKPSLPQWIQHPVQSGLTALGRGAASAPGVMNAAASTARGAGAFGASGGGTLAGAIGKAQAQDAPTGNAPTMAWAVQSVLASGDTGLAPEDEQRLTDALLDGDEDKVISANFALQMKSPGYGARLQRELESLQQEE